MNSIYNKAIYFLMFAVLLFGSYCVVGAEKQKIKREVAGISLGMSIQEVGKVFQMEEKEDTVITLMRKYGFGDPDKQAKINKLIGKKVFALKGNLPQGVGSMEALFRKGVLYQIALHYDKDYVQRVDWDVFTLPAIRKYGQPSVSNNINKLGSFSYHWSDGHTKLEIAKGGSLSEDKNRFNVTVYNVFYTDLAIYNALKKDKKNEEEKVRVAPEF